MIHGSAIDLSRMPAPDVVEIIDYEAIVARLKADFLARWEAIRVDKPELPEFDATVLESDPFTALFESNAYYATILRSRVNDAAKAVMLAYAGSGDLDHLGGLYNVPRFDGESDDRYRRRLQLAPEAFSTCGAEGAYVFHALTADPTILDASAAKVAPGHVLVSILNSAEDRTATDDQLEIVRRRLGRDDVRPLTDIVTVLSGEPVDTAIEADLWIKYGPDEAIVLAAASAALDRVRQACRLGVDLSRSEISAALHQAGVHHVDLKAPAETVVWAAHNQWVRFTSVEVTVAGRER